MDFALKPYTPQPDARETRRFRRRVAIVLVLFCLIYGVAFSFFPPRLIPALLAPQAILAAIVIWALPEAHRPPIHSLQWLFFAFIIALIGWPNYLAVSFAGLPWITVVRVAAFPMTFLLLICASTSRAFRAGMRAALSASPIIVGAFLVLTLLSLLSIALSPSKGESIQRFIIAQVMWSAPFFTAIFVFRKPGQAEKWVGFMWSLAVFICLIGLVEYKLQHLPWRDHVPSFLKINDEAVVRALKGTERANTGQYRVQSVYSHPITLSEYLALTVPFVLHKLIYTRHNSTRVAASASIVIMAAIVHFTQSRSGSIGFLIAVLMSGFFWGYEQWRRSRTNMFGTLVFFGYPVGALAGLAATFVVGRLRHAIWGGGETKASNYGRVMQWKSAIPKIERNPIGHGFGMAGITLNFHEPGGELTIDSYYLNMLLEVGVLGFLVFLVMWGAGVFFAGRWALSVGRRDRELSLLAPISIALTSFLFIKSVFSEMDNHPVAYILLGMAVALIYRAKTELGAPEPLFENLLRPKSRAKTPVG